MRSHFYHLLYHNIKISQHKDIVNKDSDMFYLKIRNNGKSNYYIDLIDKFNVPYKWYYVLRYKQHI